MVNTDEHRRDFIADEIQKRIIGPGMTCDAFVCKDDASDEILDNRPNIVYTAGILFAKKTKEDISGIMTDHLEGEEADEDSQEQENESQGTEQNIDNNNSRGLRKDASENVNDNDRADFEPDHIGLVTCLDNSVNEVFVDIKYGLYHHINGLEVENYVKVRLGRCSLEQLKKTFEYYDSCSSVKNNLKLFGCKCMADIFSINEKNLTISPKKIFLRTERGKSTPIYLQATNFPRLLQNIAADVFIDLFREQGKAIELKHIEWEALQSELKKFASIRIVKNFMDSNGISDIESILDYNEQDKKVRTKKRKYNIDNLNEFRYYLYVDDPVYDHLLPLLLQYNFFRREQIVLDTIKLPTEIGTYKPVSTGAGHIELHWKVIGRNGKKYLKVQLQNVYKEPLGKDGKPKKDRSIEANLYQTELKISSSGIIPYTEPHRSSIDDEEYSVNEELYRDVLMYGKGVNCGFDWEGSNSDKDQNMGHPTWVRTNYAPKQRAAAFSAVTPDQSTNDACVVYDLSIGSTVNKQEIIAMLKNIANNYEKWHNGQKIANNNVVLKGILDEQEDFYNRLIDNIDYLDKNDRAFKCFQIANTAMYIQMIIARDPNFKKDRDHSEYTSETTIYKDGAWEFFSTRHAEIKYRPFQLAFLLMNVKSTFENDDRYRNDNVDLIWFPTGGGKTEAYLALTALTIAERRTSGNEDVSGVSVIMRYTLRLLTAQQFERASFLICALEYLRKALLTKTEYGISLGGEPVTIGMWIGSASTPNRLNDLRNGKFQDYYSSVYNGTKPTSNPFPISYCPWCGCKLESTFNPNLHGYNRNGELHCINARNCSFDKLPIMYIDECIYKEPPTLLFATVDKFAQLTNEERGRMLGAGTNRRRPDLIIQDEMHLISGPLGSLVGMFETMVEEICTFKDATGNVRRPKIIASTATTRNTLSLIKQLYARKVRTFPVSGISYSDNYFSHVLKTSESKRQYMGLAPTGHSASELEIRTIAAEIVGKEKMISTYLLDNGVELCNIDSVHKTLTNNQSLIKDIDNYWSLVLYYTNLKSLGRTHSRIGQEILANAESMRKYLYEYPSLDFIISGFQNRTEEFTSRQDSARIKSLLVEAESAPILQKPYGSKIFVNYNMDIVQATNMISVGIDIARWNIIFMVGQPLTTAEYIQSSSRVGRTTHGLVVNIYNSLRNRELSFYENYVPYHQEFYKFVEPLMATTFTPVTLEKLIYNLYLCYMGAVKCKTRPSDVNSSDVNELKDLLTNRNNVITGNSTMASLINKMIDKVDNDLKITERNNKTFVQLLSRAGGDTALQAKVMNSLRDIESNTYIKYE